MKTTPLASAILLVLLATPAAAQETRPSVRFERQIEAPELSGPVPGPSTPPSERSRAVDAVGRTDPGAGAAYAAFQRGYYLTALRLALPRAETGDPAAQTLVAEIYWNGHGVARDAVRAAEFYRFAADGGNREAQFALANILLRGAPGVAADAKEAEAFMRRAAKAGHPRAQFNLGQLITAARPTWAGFARALPWYEKAAAEGVPDAHYALSQIHAEAKGVAVNDEAKALFHLREAARGGLDTAQAELGIWLANGRGAKKDEKAALGWFRRAAAKGNVVAQNRLARMHALGLGTARDMIKAGAWHVIARRAGFTDTDMDRRFDALSEIDKKRAIEAANQITRRLG